MEWKSLIETQYYNVDKTESINITIPEFVKNNKEVKTLGIWCSGGADSSALLYLLCKDNSFQGFLNQRNQNHNHGDNQLHFQFLLYFQ